MRLDPVEKLKLDEQNSIVPNSALTLPKTIIEIPTKNYVDEKFIDPRIIKSTARVDFMVIHLDNVRFVKVNSMPAVREHLTPRHYVGHANFYHVDEISFFRLDPDEKIDLDEQNSIVINSTLTSPKTKIDLPTKSYLDSRQKIN